MQLVFVLLIVYQLKHFIIDYPLQGRYMLGKFKPGWDFVLPLTAHAGLHGLGTAVICFAFGRPNLALPLALLDFTIHFIMDRIKASPRWLGRFKTVTAEQFKNDTAALNSAKGKEVHVLTAIGLDAAKKRLRDNKFFWYSLGFDQMVHHLTHYVCIWFIIS
jgi:hypothetical protein